MKIIIQVPVDKDLVARLDQLAAQEGISRAAVIRTACTRYLSQLERDARVSSYVEGYRRVPDESSAAESLAWLTAADLADESWPEAPHRKP